MSDSPKNKRVFSGRWQFAGVPSSPTIALRLFPHKNDRLNQLLREFRENNSEYLQKVQQFAVVSQQPRPVAATPELKTGPEPGNPVPDFDAIISACLQRLAGEQWLNSDQKKLKFLISFLERAGDGSGESKALTSLADFHLKSGEVEKAAQILERLIYSGEWTDVHRAALNRAVREARLLE